MNKDEKVQLFSQPGKHAFSPRADFFELIPNLETCTDEDAGNEGLIVAGPFQGVYETNDERNRMVNKYLRRFRFQPSMEFEKYELPKELFVTWDDLFKEIPLRIETMLAAIQNIQEEEDCE